MTPIVMSRDCGESMSRFVARRVSWLVEVRGLWDRGALSRFVWSACWLVKVKRRGHFEGGGERVSGERDLGCGSERGRAVKWLLVSRRRRVSESGGEVHCERKLRRFVKMLPGPGGGANVEGEDDCRLDGSWGGPRGS